MENNIYFPSNKFDATLQEKQNRNFDTLQQVQTQIENLEQQKKELLTKLERLNLIKQSLEKRITSRVTSPESGGQKNRKKTRKSSSKKVRGCKSRRKK